jgi:hypothetical protein
MDGSRHSLYLIPEVTHAITPATPVWQPVINKGVTLALTKDTLESAIIRQDRKITDVRHGARKVGGDIQTELMYGAFDTMLEATLCGTWATGVPIVGTDRLKDALVRRSFSMERVFADASDMPYHRFVGCEFSSVQLAVKANAMTEATFKVFGIDLTLSASIVSGATYSNPLTNPPLDGFTGVMKEGGTTVAVITEFQVSVENNLGAKMVVGSKISNTPSIGRCKVTGQVGAYFETNTLLQKFINETETSLSFTMPDGLGNSMLVNIPRAKYTGGQPDVKNEGPIILTMPFVALYDSVTQATIIFERTPHL